MEKEWGTCPVEDTDTLADTATDAPPVDSIQPSQSQMHMWDHTMVNEGIAAADAVWAHSRLASCWCITCRQGYSLRSSRQGDVGACPHMLEQWRSTQRQKPGRWLRLCRT